MHVVVVDDRPRKLTLREPPRRIVSLVPSDTYSLVALGARARLVGRTRYCVEPAAELGQVPIVGGTKDADVDAVLAAEPDLVVANQEECNKRDIERIEAAGVPVLVSFPRTVREGLAHVARLARVLGLERRAGSREPEQEAARALLASLYHTLSRVEASAPPRTRSTFVPIWMDPLMTANEHTFLSSMLGLLGCENVFASRERRYPLMADLGRAAGLSVDRTRDRDTRYPRVTPDEVRAAAPELLLLPSEPHEFTGADVDTLRALCPSARVVRCDGADLLWYGVRAIEGLPRLSALLASA